MGCCPVQCPLGFLPERKTPYSTTAQFSTLQISSKAEKWMKNLNDSTDVSTLSIPGTHDSATYATPCYGFVKLSQCQVLSIKEQLSSGIRYLDIRIRQIHGQLIMCHGIVKLGPFRQVALQIADFLHRNPSEFLIITFQNKDNGQNDAGAKILEIFTMYRVQCVLSGQIPTVGQLRGKVWIYKSYDVNFATPTFELLGQYGILDRQELYLQNYYVVDEENSVRFKVERVLDCLAFNHRQGFERPRMKVNFLSISGPDRCTGAFTGPYPYQNALDPEGPNAAFYKQLQGEDKRVLGITVMDFPSPELILKIINRNQFNPGRDL